MTSKIFFLFLVLFFNVLSVFGATAIPTGLQQSCPKGAPTYNTFNPYNSNGTFTYGGQPRTTVYADHVYNNDNGQNVELGGYVCFALNGSATSYAINFNACPTGYSFQGYSSADRRVCTNVAPPNTYLNTAINTYLPIVDPTCTSSQYLDTTTHTCITNPTCVGTQTFNATTHQCDNPVCNDNQVLNPDTFICESLSCIGDQTLNTTTHQCDDPVCKGDEDLVNGVCQIASCPSNQTINPITHVCYYPQIKDSAGGDSQTYAVGVVQTNYPATKGIRYQFSIPAKSGTTLVESKAIGYPITPNVGIVYDADTESIYYAALATIHPFATMKFTPNVQIQIKVKVDNDSLASQFYQVLIDNADPPPEGYALNELDVYYYAALHRLTDPLSFFISDVEAANTVGAGAVIGGISGSVLGGPIGTAVGAAIGAFVEGLMMNLAGHAGDFLYSCFLNGCWSTAPDSVSSSDASATYCLRPNNTGTPVCSDDPAAVCATLARYHHIKAMTNGSPSYQCVDSSDNYLAMASATLYCQDGSLNGTVCTGLTKGKRSPISPDDSRNFIRAGIGVGLKKGNNGNVGGGSSGGGVNLGKGGADAAKGGYGAKPSPDPADNKPTPANGKPDLTKPDEPSSRVPLGKDDGFTPDGKETIDDRNVKTNCGGGGNCECVEELTRTIKDAMGNQESQTTSEGSTPNWDEVVKGSGGTTTSPSTPDPSIPDTSGGNSTPSVDQCQKYPDTIGCSKWGTPDRPDTLETKDIPVDVKPDEATPAQCPAPLDVELKTGHFKFSFSNLCKFAQKIKPLVIAAGWLQAAYIVFAVII